MDAYDKRLAPKAFGLNNTGVICYFNSFLQTLASCTSFARGVMLNADYLRRTSTGTAVVDFVSAYATCAPDGSVVARESLASGIEFLSAAVLRALVSDLAARRPHVRFGGGQESASEALLHLLDMMEPPRRAATADPENERNPTPVTSANASDAMPAAIPTAGPALAVDSTESPITNLFIHRFRCDVHCRKCKAVVSTTTDYAVNFNLFHFDQLRTQPTDVAEFSKAVRLQASTTEGYCCPACPCTICGATPIEGRCPVCNVAAPTATALRLYSLTMIPEIVFCTFNLYVGYGGIRRARYFPERLEFPARDGGLLIFRLVGQVEHAGSLSGGHYWARALRANEQVCLLNDSGVSPAEFAPTSNTYIVAYHYVGREQ